jgi:hypothetical protein
MPRSWRVHTKALVVSVLFLAPCAVNAQSTLFNRLLCPLSTPGCMQTRVDYQAVQSGGSQFDIFLRVLQQPQYPTDPSWMSVFSFGFIFGNLQQEVASNPLGVGLYGAVQNDQGPHANSWRSLTDGAAVIAYADNAAVSGCTPDPTGASGYRTCTAADPNATVRFSLYMPYQFDLALLRYAEVTGTSANGLYSCNALVTGRTASQAYSSPDGNGNFLCDVSDATDPLTLGAYRAVVTPEPPTLLLLVTAVAGVLGIARRRRRA